VDDAKREKQEMNPTAVRVSVNQDLCVGNAMCRAIAPKAFIASPNGKSVVGNPEFEDSELLTEAADTCPVAAIEVSSSEH
jgi:ferredoxin